MGANKNTEFTVKEWVGQAGKNTEFTVREWDWTGVQKYRVYGQGMGLDRWVKTSSLGSRNGVGQAGKNTEFRVKEWGWTGGQKTPSLLANRRAHLLNH